MCPASIFWTLRMFRSTISAIGLRTESASPAEVKLWSRRGTTDHAGRAGAVDQRQGVRQRSAGQIADAELRDRDVRAESARAKSHARWGRDYPLETFRRGVLN